MRRPGSCSARSQQPWPRGSSRTRSCCSSIPPTVTTGRRTEESELHIPAGAEVDVVATDRGGKSTFHGPGQLVCYPIFDLKRHGQDVKRYCRDLEEALILTLAKLRVEAQRIDGLTGVWLTPPPRKIASIGIHIAKWVTTHGYALNVDLDPAPFTQWITACGLEDAAFTTVARELGRPVAVEEVRGPALEALAEVFGLELEELGGRAARGAMTVEIRPFARPDWSPLPHEGCIGVEGKVLVREGDFFIAMLRFPEHATIHEHPGETDTIVVCIDGAGFTSVGTRLPRSPRASRCAGRRASRIGSGPRTRP